MDNRKSIAIVIAMFSAILVMLAGKSCAESMNRQKKSNTKASISMPANATVNTGNVIKPTSAGNTRGVQEYTMTENKDTEIEYITDILGRVVGTVEHSLEPTESTTEPQVEYITDILGRVVSVIEPTTVTTTEDPEATTEHKNILEKYREEHPELTKPTKESDIEDEHYKVPSTIYITIG